MFCKNCGSPMEDGEVFCLNCGCMNEAEVKEAEETTVSQKDAEGVRQTETADVQNDEVEKMAETYDAVAVATTATEGKPEAASELEKVSEPDPTVQSEDAGIFCFNCGTKNKVGDTFCCACGTPLNVEGEANAILQQPTKQKGNKKMWIFLPVGALLAVIVVFLAMKMVGGVQRKDSVLYIKDNTLYQSDLKQKAPTEIEDKMLSVSYDVTYHEGAYLGNYITYSPDHKYLFFVTVNQKEKKLYYMRTDKKNAEKEKIGSISSGTGDAYYVTKDNKVIYLSDDNKLCMHDLKDREKIASDVSQFWISEDEKTILWQEQNNGKLYVQALSLKKDKEKLDSDVSWVVDYSSDFKTIVYRKDSDLYIIKNLSEKEKIASDVQDVACTNIEESLKIVYTTGEEAEVCVADFIHDDMAEADRNMVEPNIEDYQTETIVQSFWGDRVKTETDDAYYEKEQEYEEKQDRDYWRERLQDYTMYLTRGELFIYDDAEGESTSVVQGYMGDIATAGLADNNLTAIFECTPEEDVQKYKFSELYNNRELGSIEDRIYYDVNNGAKTYVLNGTEYEAILEDTDGHISTVKADRDSGKFYAGIYEPNEEAEDRNNVTIVEISSSKKSLGEVKELYTDVYGWDQIHQGNIYYYMDVDDAATSGDLYCNDEKIDNDVRLGSVQLISDDSRSFLYYTDWDTNGYDGGTLKLYNGKDSNKVANDVVDYLVMDEKQIITLDNYSDRDYTGDLHLYNGKELKKLDTDVTMLIKP